MWMKIFKVLLTLTYSIIIATGQHKYELEFFEEGIYKSCEKYPDNRIEGLFDLSNAHFEQAADGQCIGNGYYIAKDIQAPLQIVAEIFKKERGTWQPTLMTQKRPDLCTAMFDEDEEWHPFFKNTSKEQQKCPFFEGQRVDFDVSHPAVLLLPQRNAEGEYNIHVEAINTNRDVMFCVDIYVMAHKV